MNIPNYKIGVTFSSNYRKNCVEPFVKALLECGFSKEEIFYDDWHDDIINGPDGAKKLRKIYHCHCECVVVLLSPDYKSKKWTNKIEWPAILELINENEGEKICLLRIDSAKIGEIDGLYDYQTIAKNIDNETPDSIACFIKKVYDRITSSDSSMPLSEKVDASEANEFPNKLYKLYKDDGMMRYLYESFQPEITNNAFTLKELKLLSKIQDEYQKMFDKYWSDDRETDTAGVDRILASKEVEALECDLHTHPLITTYLHFVRADKMYFTNDYIGAIQKYKEAENKIMTASEDEELSMLDKQKNVYIQNSIAWSYFKAGQCDKAIEVYRKMFEIKDIDECWFSWKYRRNYGVCLENRAFYLEAIDQYEKAISTYSKVRSKGTFKEYKLYFTYCSATMKYWDKHTEKCSGKWIDNIRNLYNKPEGHLLRERVINSVEARLKLAQIIIEKKQDADRLIPDYYNQLSKLETYRMILSTTEEEKNENKEEIIKNLQILEDISGSAKGYHFIKRDFYYALYEMEEDATKRKEYLQISLDENDALNKKGDAPIFGDMLMSKKHDEQEENEKWEDNEKRGNIDIN